MSLPVTGRTALTEAVEALRAAGVDTPERDARALLADAAGVTRDRLSLILPEPMTDAARETFAGMVRARCDRKPVARILGRRLFWDRWFEVTPDVLDPRADTEALIALALELPFATVLDLGTGSGCIAVTLLAERADATGVATDVSAGALAVAGRNAAACGVAERLQLQESDWFLAVEGRFDLIVSNPPYIALEEMAGLAQEVRGHDPRGALTDEGDGLSAYRAIAAGAEAHLVPGGRILVEIGARQGAAVAGIFLAQGLEQVAVHPDMEGRDRVVSARVPGRAAT